MDIEKIVNEEMHNSGVYETPGFFHTENHNYRLK